MGGMTKAVESGWAKMKIEECAAEKQARIDSGKDVIVGVNKYKLAKEDPIDILDIDNHAVREAQIERLASAPRATRPPSMLRWPPHRVRQDRRRQPARPAVKAVRLRATVGEISDALEVVFGRHRANPQAVTGIYNSVVEGNEDWQALKADIDAFVAEEGRRPRIMIAKLGQDGHDRGAKVVASAFADLGFDIDIGPLFQTPEEAARHAIENDACVGCSSLAAGHKTLPAIIKAAQGAGADDIIVFVGGVIPAQDYDACTRPVRPASSGPARRSRPPPAKC
jgi:methylmalonyl-CoA mutase